MCVWVRVNIKIKGGVCVWRCVGECVECDVGVGEFVCDCGGECVIGCCVEGCVGECGGGGNDDEDEDDGDGDVARGRGGGVGVVCG